MQLSDIEIVGRPSALPTERDVEALARHVGSRLPEGYAEYVLALGEGVLGDTVRVYPPSRIVDELQEWRERIREYWFWSGLAQERALESVIVADTCGGDELVFHPARPDALWVLPRDTETALEVGNGLWAAIDWLCASGILMAPFSARRFVPESRPRARGA